MNIIIPKKPLFSILIANYNNGQYLEECLQSIFNQIYQNWEIIIVDDGSTDGVSKKLYDKYKTHTQIKIFYNKENIGCGYTKRRCAEEARGEICAFLDPDDTITPDALEIMVHKHLEFLNLSLVYSTHYLCDENLVIQNLNYQVKQISSKGYFCSQNAKVSAFASYKNHAYKRTEGINPKLKRAVDQDLYYKLDEEGEFLFINKPLYYYRRHSKGISTFDNELKAIYWHQIVKTNTYRRRKKNRHPYNLSYKKIQSSWFTYFIKKAFQKSRQLQYMKMYYLLFQALKNCNFNSENLSIIISIAIYPIRRNWHP